MIAPMKRLVTLLAVTLLVSCGGGGGGEGCDTQYWDGTLGTCLPAAWHVVTGDELQARGVPEDVLVAFQADDAVSGLFPIVTVTSEALSGDYTSERYSEESVQSVQGLPGYEIIDQRSMAVDGENVRMHIFGAQPVNEEPKQRFYQVSAVHEQKGYTLTAVLPLSIESTWEDAVTLILTHLSFKNPEESQKSEE
jgi:hypothetical protein